MGLKMNILTIYRKVAMYTGPDGAEYVRKVGSRQEVWDRVVYCTSGKLTRENLELKGGKLISKRRSALGKKRYSKGAVFQKKPPAPEIIQEDPAVDDAVSEPVASPPKKPGDERHLRQKRARRRAGRRK